MNRAIYGRFIALRSGLIIVSIITDRSEIITSFLFKIFLVI